MRANYENSPNGRPAFASVLVKPTHVPLGLSNAQQFPDFQRVAIVVPPNHPIMNREPLACIRDSSTLLVNNNAISQAVYKKELGTTKPPFLKPKDLIFQQPVQPMICVNPNINNVVNVRHSRNDRIIDSNSQMRSISPSIPFSISSQLVRSSSVDHSSRTSASSSRIEIPQQIATTYQTLVQPQDFRTVTPLQQNSHSTRTVQSFNNHIVSTISTGNVNGNNGYQFSGISMQQLPTPKNLSESAMKLLATYQKSKDILFQTDQTHSTQQKQTTAAESEQNLLSLKKETTAASVAANTKGNKPNENSIQKSNPRIQTKKQVNSSNEVNNYSVNKESQQHQFIQRQGNNSIQSLVEKKSPVLFVESQNNGHSDSKQFDASSDLITCLLENDPLEDNFELFKKETNQQTCKQGGLVHEKSGEDRENSESDILDCVAEQNLEIGDEVESNRSMEHENYYLEEGEKYPGEEINLGERNSRDVNCNGQKDRLEDVEVELLEEAYCANEEVQQNYTDASISAISCENSNVQIEEYEIDVIPQLQQQFEEKFVSQAPKNYTDREVSGQKVFLSQPDFYQSSSHEKSQTLNSPTSFESSDILPVTFKFDGFKKVLLTDVPEGSLRNQNIPFKVRTGTMTQEFKQPFGSVVEEKEEVLQQPFRDQYSQKSDCIEKQIVGNSKKQVREVGTGPGEEIGDENMEQEPHFGKPQRTYRDAQTSPIKVINALDTSGIYQNRRSSRENINSNSTSQEVSQNGIKIERGVLKGIFESGGGFIHPAFDRSRPLLSQFQRQEYFESGEILNEQIERVVVEEEDYIKKRNREIKEEILKKRRAKKIGSTQPSRKGSSNEILPPSSLDSSRIAQGSKREINISTESSRSIRMNQDLSYISGTSSIQEQALKKRDEILLQISQIDQQIKYHNSKKKSEQQRPITASITKSSKPTPITAATSTGNRAGSRSVHRSDSNSEEIHDKSKQRRKHDGFIIPNAPLSTPGELHRSHQSSTRSNSTSTSTSKHVPKIIAAAGTNVGKSSSIHQANSVLQTGFNLPNSNQKTSTMNSGHVELTKAEQNLLSRQFPPSKSKINKTPISSFSSTPSSTQSSSSSLIMKIDPTATGNSQNSNQWQQKEDIMSSQCQVTNIYQAKQQQQNRPQILDFTKKRETPVKVSQPLSSRNRKQDDEQGDQPKETRNNHRIPLNSTVKPSSEPLAIINLFEIQKTKKREGSLSQQPREEVPLDKYKQQSQEVNRASSKPPRKTVALSNTHCKHSSPKKDKINEGFFPLQFIPITQVKLADYLKDCQFKNIISCFDWCIYQELDLEAEHERRQQMKAAAAVGAMQATTSTPILGGKMNGLHTDQSPIKHKKAIGIKGGKYEIDFGDFDCEDFRETSEKKSTNPTKFDSEFSPIH